MLAFDQYQSIFLVFAFKYFFDFVSVHLVTHRILGLATHFTLLCYSETRALL